MEYKEIIKPQRDFNNAVCLMGVIPFLVFVYLLVTKIASFGIFVGEVGYIMFATLAVFLSGIFAGKRLLWTLMQQIIEKNRLAAITETALSLGHEINNPLLVMQGNLELLETDFAEGGMPDTLKNRVNAIKNHCERIMQATQKLASLSKAVSVTIHDDVKMVDLSSSR